MAPNEIKSTANVATEKPYQMIDMEVEEKVVKGYRAEN